MTGGVLDLLDNREKAVAVWLVIFAISAVVVARAPLRMVLQSLAHPKIALPLAGSLTYTATVFLAGTELGWWDHSAAKVACFWYFGTAVILFLSSSEAEHDEQFFEKAVRRSFSFAALLTFIVNVPVFGFWTELALVTCVLALTMFSAVAQGQPQFATQGRIYGGCLTVIGGTLLVLGVVRIVTNMEGVQLEEVYLPPFLTVLFLPFLYGVALYAIYDSMFVRTGWLLRDQPHLARRVKWTSIKLCRININCVRRFATHAARELTSLADDDDADVDAMVDSFRRGRSSDAKT